MSGTGLVLFAHGARDPAWSRPFEKIRDNVRSARPTLHVELAFLEIMQPPLAEAVAKLIASGCDAITIAPLFMAQGGHLKRDVPLLLDSLRTQHPGIKLRLLPAVGEVDIVLEAISNWLCASAAEEEASR